MYGEFSHDDVSRQTHPARVAAYPCVLPARRLVTSPPLSSSDTLLSGTTSVLRLKSATNRSIYPGASNMGWSHRVRTPNKSITPWINAAPLIPPSGWDVLWGDPSMASNPQKPNMVFLCNLAIAHDKFEYVSGLRGTPGRIEGTLSMPSTAIATNFTAG